MALGKKIREHRERLGWTLDQLSEKSGVEIGTISALENRDSSKSKYAPALAAALGVDPFDLMTEVETVFVARQKHAEYRSTQNHLNADPAPAPGNSRKIGVVGTAQLGDDGYWAELEYPAGHGDGYVEHSTRDANAYALRCKGDSMKPRIKNGEFVIIEPGHVPIPGDEVMVKCKEGRVMVKELLYIRDGVVYLGSVNEAHGKITIPLQDVESIHYVGAIIKSSYWKPD